MEVYKEEEEALEGKSKIEIFKMFHHQPTVNESDPLPNWPHSNTNDEVPILPNGTGNQVLSPPASITIPVPHTSPPRAPSLPQPQQAVAVPPVTLPNLAQEALGRLANKRQPVEDDDNDFVTVKKKKVEESSGYGDEEVSYSLCFTLTKLFGTSHHDSCKPVVSVSNLGLTREVTELLL